MVKTVTVNLNVTDLYKILAENPCEAANVLRNIYGFEVLKLKTEVQKTAKFVEDEDGLDGSRDRYIEEELENLTDKFDEATLLMKFFRFVNLADSGETKYTSDMLINDLEGAKMLVDIETIFFHGSVHAVRAELAKASVSCYDSKFEKDTHGEKIFLDWKNTAIKRLEEVVKTLDTIDSKIGSK